MNKFNQEKLFFIIAPDRSGTTMLQEIMNTFSNFCNYSESRIAGPDSPSCWEFVQKHNDFSYLENFIKDNWTSEFFVEKSPPSINCIPQISNRYPNAKFILLKRDPRKIILSQLNLHYGISDIGTRQGDMGNILLKENSIILKRELIMAKRLLKMISNQLKYKNSLKNRVELRYEDIVGNLDSQIDLLEKNFAIKCDRKKAHKQIKKPSSSSTFRYGLTKLTNNGALNIARLACKLWGYQ